MILDILSTDTIFFPWPTSINGQKFEGLLIPEPATCKSKCDYQECRRATCAEDGEVCKYGFTYYNYIGHNIHLVVYGVVGRSREVLPKYKHLKSQTKGRSVLPAQFATWINKITDLLDCIKSYEDRLLSQVLHPLHDTMRLANEIQDIAVKIVENDKLISFDENFSKATKEVKTLYKASGLLVETFDSASIYFNPEAAKFGRPVNTELYKLLHKLQLILSAEAARNSTRFFFEGRGYKTYSLYESFKLLPLALLQNAINYNQSGDILLKIEENNYFARIYVTSSGPLIEEHEKQSIFQRAKRGKWASKYRNDGMGIGLYIGSIVASAHDIFINVESEPLKYEINGVPQARNTFWFSVRSGGVGTL